MGVDLEAAAAQPALRISVAGLRRALVAGARRVIARRELLNRINVFPVADGDTGTNLAFTLSAVLAGALSRRAVDAATLLRDVAEDALSGARGNSGVILAQFLHGVAETVGHARVLTPALVAEAVAAGAGQARAALSRPQEGTILSVIGAFAEGLQRPAPDLREWFGTALRKAERALLETPRQLAVLRQAGVVDAGAQGFVDLLGGIGEFLDSGRVPAPERVEYDDLHAAAVAAEAGPDADGQRWCSECVLEGPQLDRAAIRTAVEALGAASIVLAGGASRMRLHAHVNDPGALFERMASFGRVGQRKADDMQAQQRALARRDHVAVVTDSGADLPEALLASARLSMVPVRVNFGDEDYLDKVTLRPAEFYARMRAGGLLPRTSQPPPGDFRRQFEFLLSHHPSLCYVGISRALSGTLQSGESAASRLEPARVRVLDSGHASCGQGLVALALAEAAAAGADGVALADLVATLRRRTHTFACARDIGHAVRGGRVPRWVAPLARALPLTPIARMDSDGRLRVRGVLPGRDQVPARFARYVARRLRRGARVRVLVGHCGCEADGQALLAHLRQLLDCEDAWLVEAGPAVGAHAGPGALVVGVQER